MGKKGRKKRFWPDAEKRLVCAQALTPGVLVARVTRRYAMNANLIFKWLKDPRFSPERDNVDAAADATPFLPVEIAGIRSASGLSDGSISPIRAGSDTARFRPIALTSRCRTVVVYW